MAFSRRCPKELPTKSRALESSAGGRASTAAGRRRRVRRPRVGGVGDGAPLTLAPPDDGRRARAPRCAPARARHARKEDARLTSRRPPAPA